MAIQPKAVPRLMRKSKLAEKKSLPKMAETSVPGMFLKKAAAFQRMMPMMAPRPVSLAAVSLSLRDFCPCHIHFQRMKRTATIRTAIRGVRIQPI